MIICTTCGFHNDDGAEFCGQCGEFLEFSGHRVVDDQPEPAPLPPPVDEARGGLVQRVKHAVGLDDDDEPDGGPAATEAPSELSRLQAEADAARGQAQQAEEARSRAAAVEAERVAAARTEALHAAAVARRLAEAEAAAQQATTPAVASPPTGPPTPPPPATPPDDGAAGPETVVIQPPPPRRPRGGPATAGPDVPPPPTPEGQPAAQATDEVATLRAEAARADAARAEADRARREAEDARRQAEEATAAAEAEADRTRRAAALVARGVTVQPAASAPAPPSTPPPAPSPGPGPTTTGDGPPASQGPGAVLPGEARPRPKQVAPSRPSRRIEPGDLVCGHCGEGNDPERRFCRRCGTTLAEAEVARAPWWRRIVPRRRREVVAAGERPGQQSGRGPGAGAPRRAGRRIKVLVAAAIGAVVLLTAFGPLRGPFDRVADRARRIVAPEFESVSPTRVGATTQAADHPPTDAVDLVRTTSWAEGADGPGEGEALILEFDEPTDLARIGITPGASAEAEEFTAQPRPKVLRIVVVDGEAPVSEAITLEDAPDFQRFTYEASGVRRLEIRIESVYPSSQGGEDCSIAEVELFREKG